MGILDTVKKPGERPTIMTICGDAGMGKTSLACTFPKPIVIRGEDGLQAIPLANRPDAFPLLTNPLELWDQITALIKEEHDYKTLIVDSVTAIERLFIQSVVDADGKAKGIQQAGGGYGAGRDMVSGMHHRLRKGVGLLSDQRNMHIIFIAHVEPGKVDPPDQESHTKYGLRMHLKSEASYVDDVDLVGYLKLQTFMKGEVDKKKAISDGTRILECQASAAHVSKNRYGIEETLIVKKGENPLVDYIPSLKSVAKGK